MRLAPAAVGDAAEPAAPKAPAAKPPAAAAGKAAEDRNQPVTVDADHMESFQRRAWSSSPAVSWRGRTAPSSTPTGWRSTSTSGANG